MKIKRIILHKYKRFSLKKIETFDLTPTTVLTVLNWSNGVGKSSLLHQLNPLPAELKKDFHPDGYKIIEIEHLGREYKLTSKDGKHSFIEDGEELNQGGTKRAQLELVESKFKLNPNNIQVVNGNVKFSLMSPSERKHWLTKISTVDYAFPISIYNKLLEMKRDNSGVMKNAKEIIAQCEKQIIEQGSIDNIRKEESFVVEIIEDLLKSYKATTVNRDYEEIVNSISSTVKFIKDTGLTNIYFNIEDLEKRNEDLKSSLKAILEKEEFLSKQLNTISESTDPKLIKETEEKINKLKTFITENYPYEQDTSKIQHKLQIGKHIITILESIVNSMDEFKQKLVTTLEGSLEPEQECKNKKELLLEKVFLVKKAIENIDNENKILKEAATVKVTCDNCNSPVNISGIIDSRNKLKEEYSEKLAILEKDIKLLNYKLSLHRERMILIEGFKQIVFDPFNKDLPEEVSIKQIKTILDSIRSRVHSIYTSILPVSSEIDILSKQLETYKNKVQLASDLAKERTITITKEMDKLIEDKKEVIKKITDIKALISKREVLLDKRESLVRDLKRFNYVKKSIKQEKDNEIIEFIVASLKTKLTKLRSIIESRTDLEKHLKHQNKTLEDKEESNSILDALINILSPTNGLIAKSVNSFIGKFISDVNLIINSVWSYKMKLLPCEISDTSDLDYKFRVEVNDSFIIEDVSKLSSSMQEIVDLAFRLVFIKYMDFHGIPIMLDEFGRTMDQDHRIQSFNMVDSVICSTYEQVFLVSHFEEIYGRFKNASFPQIE